jgi:hypothetical protein
MNNKVSIAADRRIVYGSGKLTQQCMEIPRPKRARIPFAAGAKDENAGKFSLVAGLRLRS